MDIWGWLAANLGLVVFTVICAGLVVYLTRAMVRPESV